VCGILNMLSLWCAMYCQVTTAWQRQTDRQSYRQTCQQHWQSMSDSLSLCLSSFASVLLSSLTAMFRWLDTAHVGLGQLHVSGFISTSDWLIQPEIINDKKECSIVSSIICDCWWYLKLVTIKYYWRHGFH